MAYQYILDGSTILANEPLGWDKSKLKIARDDVLKGIFVKYVTTLIFVGDGYDYILSVANSSGICSVIDVEINDNSSQDAFHFSGKIYIENVKINLSKCTAECVIEDDSLAQSVIRLLKTKVECYATALSISGEAITPVGVNVNFGLLTTPRGDGGAAYLASVSAPVGTKKAFNIFDLTQYLLNYLTDNEITLKSDLLTTDYLMEKRSYTLGGTVAPGDVISYSYVNVWGQTFSDTVTAADTSLNTLATQIVSDIRIPYAYTAPNDPTSFAQAALYQGDLLTYITNLFDSGAGQSFSTTIKAHYFAPFTISFSSTGATTFTETVDQSFVYGAGDLFLTSGAILNGNLNQLNLSLEDILTNLNKWCNINVRFYKSGGVQYARIEQAKYFFDQISDITINSFDGLTQEFVTDIGLSGVNYSQPGQPTPDYGIFSVASYATKNCYVRTQESTSEWKLGHQFIFGNNYLDMSNEEIVVFQSNGTILNNDWLTMINRTSFNTGVGSGYYYGGWSQLVLSGLPLIHYHVAKNHGYFGSPTLVFNGRTLTIDDVIQIQKVYSFKTVLNCTTLQSLFNNPLAKIKFSDADGNLLQGWIKEAEYNIRSSLLTISIYSE